MIERSAMKRQAQEINKGAKVNVYLFSLLYLALIAALTALDTLSTGGQVQEALDFYLDMGMELPFDLSVPTLPLSPLAAAFVGIICNLLSQILSCGNFIYHLGIRQGQRMEYVNLFDGFIFPGKIILLGLVTNILTVLWSMLFFFPGIIAIYRYRFAFYNLCSDPEMGVMEAIRLSCRQTQGFKWQLFVLDMSFLGWIILDVMTAGVLGIWLTPYRVQTNVGYYHEILRKKNLPVPGQQPPSLPDTPGF